MATIFFIIASSSTVFRLVHRLRTSRMWWDDYAVILPLAANTVYYSSSWVLFKSQRQWLNYLHYFPTLLIWRCRQLMEVVSYLLQEESTRFGLLNFYFSRLSGGAFILILIQSSIEIRLAGHPVLALHSRLQECFQLSIMLVEVLFVLPPCAFWGIYLAFSFSLSFVQATRSRVFSHIVR